MCSYNLDNITLDSVLAGETCTPLSFHDFHSYLAYKEISVENLDFYIVLKSYKKNFYELPKEQQELSPKPTLKRLRPQLGYPPTSPFQLSLESTNDDSISLVSSPQMGYLTMPPKIPERSTNPNYESQPLRTEVQRILKIFIYPESPRALNLSDDLRSYVLSNAELTTNPHIFDPVERDVLEHLTTMSLPNFLGTATQTVNPRGKWMRLIRASIAIIVTAILETFLFLVGISRWYRVVGLPILAYAIITIYSSLYRGVCLKNYPRSVKQLHQYEALGELEAEFGEELLLRYALASKKGDTSEFPEDLEKKMHGWSSRTVSVGEDLQMKRKLRLLVAESVLVGTCIAMVIIGVLVALPVKRRI